MGKVQVTEYETVEQTIERYECDHCGHIVEESGINTALLATGDQTSGISGSKAAESKHLCDDCNGLRHALEVRETEEYLRARWEGFRGEVDYVLPGLTAILGTAMGVGMSWLIANNALNPELVPIEEVFAAGIVYWLCVGVAAVVLAILSSILSK